MTDETGEVEDSEGVSVVAGKIHDDPVVPGERDVRIPGGVTRLK